MKASSAESRTERLQALRALVRERRQTLLVQPEFPADCLPRHSYWSWLPAQCLDPGTVTEWCASCDGCGAFELALLTEKLLLPSQGRWLWVDDPAGGTYPIGLAGPGVALDRLVMVQPDNTADALWAVEQGLRSRGVDLVVCRLSRVSPVIGRRLKLAAEAGNSRCLLLRGPEALRETSWADVRLLVSPLPSPSWRRRRLQVELLKVRNGLPGGRVQVELDHETTAVRLVSELADPADLQRATGA